MSYRKLLIMKAVGKVAATYGNTWARKAGNTAVDRLSRMAVNRGYLAQTYNLQTLTEEIKAMHREGKFSQQEWIKAKELLRQAWQKRRK